MNIPLIIGLIILAFLLLTGNVVGLFWFAVTIIVVTVVIVSRRRSGGDDGQA
jgi:hypothetical protein